MNSAAATVASGDSGFIAIFRKTVYLLQNINYQKMKNIFSSIQDFFTKPVGGETLGLFRIFVSGFALIQFIVLLPDWMWLYGPKGLLPWEITDALSTTNTPTLSGASKLLSTLGISVNGTVYTIAGIYFVSLIGLLIGYKTRIVAIAAWLTHLTINTTGHFTAYGVETFTHISLFYCMVLPVGIKWSVDANRRDVRDRVSTYLITLSVRVIQLHLCIMYFASGMEKAMGSQWWNGEAIWIALQQDQFHQFNTNWMASVPIIPKIICWGTLIVETLYPIGMLWSKSKKFWLIGIVSMHLGIAIFLGLYLFGGLMMLLNIAVFGKHCFPNLFSVRLKNNHSRLRNEIAWVRLMRKI